MFSSSIKKVQKIICPDCQISKEFSVVLSDTFEKILYNISVKAVHDINEYNSTHKRQKTTLMMEDIERIISPKECGVMLDNYTMMADLKVVSNDTLKLYKKYGVTEINPAFSIGKIDKTMREYIPKNIRISAKYKLYMAFLFESMTVHIIQKCVVLFKNSEKRLTVNKLNEAIEKNCYIESIFNL